MNNLACRVSQRLTYTPDSSGIELKVCRAVTQVAAWRVHTQPVNAVHGVGTLVDVCGTVTMLSNTPHKTDATNLFFAQPE